MFYAVCIIAALTRLQEACVLNNYLSPQVPQWNPPKKPFCYLIFTAALFFFSIQNNPRLLSAFSRKSAYIDVYFCKTQHGSDKGKQQQRAYTLILCGSYRPISHLRCQNISAFSGRIRSCYYSLSASVFFCFFFPVYLTCVAMSTQQYSSLTWQTFRRNYSAVSFDLFVWLLPEISWF